MSTSTPTFPTHPLGVAAHYDDLFIFDACDGLQTSLSRLGVVAAGAPFNPSLGALIGPTNQSPFSGSGATGASPAQGKVPLTDQVLLATGHGGTVARYTNPIPGSPWWGEFVLEAYDDAKGSGVF